MMAAAGAFAVTTQAVAQSDPGKSWQGHYRYVHDGGTTAGDSRITVTHDLVIGPGGARGGCILASGGFQTDERIVCHASGDESGLTVAFHRYEDGRVVNKYGVALYRPGQTLFRLSRFAGGRTNPTTTWEAFRPGAESEPASGPFFERVP